MRRKYEILAETSTSDFRLQILVGGREYTRIDLDPRRPANRLHRLFLQNAQHFGLRLQAHVANLVEEDRAAVGDLELAAPIGDGAGERPAHVAEQLAFDQLFGDCGAVDFNEGRAPAAAQRVDRPRDQLFAGAVFAVNQHAAVGRGGHGDLLAELPHGIALANHRLVSIDLRAQGAVLGLERALPQGVSHHEHRPIVLERLLEKVERAQLDAAHGRLDVAVTRDQHDLGIDLTLAKPGQRHQAVHAGQPHIEHDQVDRAAGQTFEALFPARHRFDDVALVAQVVAERLSNAWLVVDDEDGRRHDAVVRRSSFGREDVSCAALTTHAARRTSNDVCLNMATLW